MAQIMEQVSDKKDSNLAVQLESLSFITQGVLPTRRF